MSPAALRALADAARALATLAEAAAADGATEPDELLLEAEAAKLARVSLRALRDARRAGELPTYGRQRSRTIRRRDLLAWIESRRAPIVRDVVAANDDDMDRRVRRIGRKRASA